jgi:hypothetical protein
MILSEYLLLWLVQVVALVFLAPTRLTFVFETSVLSVLRARWALKT